MAGRNVTITPKQIFTFAGLQANLTTGVAIGTGSARAIDATDVVSGCLMVRVSAQSMPAGATITIGLTNSLVMPDDPANLYFPPSSDPLVNAVIIQVQAADVITFPPGRLYIKQFNSINNTIAAMLLPFMSVTMAAAAGAVTINCGIDVVLRDS